MRIGGLGIVSSMRRLPGIGIWLRSIVKSIADSDWLERKSKGLMILSESSWMKSTNGNSAWPVNKPKPTNTATSKPNCATTKPKSPQ